MEVLPQILMDFKDTEIVDLLLFNLPWLCHGKPQESNNNCDVSPTGTPVKGALPRDENCLELSS